MTDHVAKSRMERFCAKVLPDLELVEVARHVVDCQPCDHQFTEELRRQRPSGDFGFTLAPEFWFRHDHLDFDQLVSYADNQLDKLQREIVDVHLKVCETCREDVRSFLAFREKTSQEMDVSYASIRREPTVEVAGRISWWRVQPWRPAYAVAILVLATLGIVTVAIVLKKKAETLAAKKNEPSQIYVLPSPTPANNINAAVQPSPSKSESPKPPTPTSSPNAVDTAVAVASLNDGTDGTRPVSVDRNGRITGLDEVPSNTRRAIADTMVAERIDKADVLNELAAQPDALRGPNRGPSFKLLSPGRVVLVGDQPTFKWERLPGASTYRVFVGDHMGHEAAKSFELPADQTEWSAPKPLTRGQVYSWAVIAVLDGKQIVSPGPASSERKFQVLPADSFKQLAQIKNTHSHLALGVFYARAGLLAEAEREFQTLVQMNPQSQLARKLLRSISLLSQSTNP